jgi:hypothetical protein
MHPNLEAAADQVFAELAGDAIIALGDEVERRSKSQGTLEVGELGALIESRATFDVVGEYDREAFAVRPAGPAVRRAAGRFADRPVAADSWSVRFAAMRLTPILSRQGR